MIRLTCPNCGSRLSAKNQLAGQTRNCPKCAHPVQVVADAASDSNDIDVAPSLSDQHVQAATEECLPLPDLPDRLNRGSHYLICNKTHVVATWENNGQGWMVKAGPGFVSAKRGHESLPSQGDFKLVELKFSMTPDGKRLSGLSSYQLATRWALTMLDQGDDQIVEKITGPGCLNRDQKHAVRQALDKQFMRPVWENAVNVREYLANADCHSSEVE